MKQGGCGRRVGLTVSFGRALSVVLNALALTAGVLDSLLFLCEVALTLFVKYGYFPRASYYLIFTSVVL